MVLDITNVHDEEVLDKLSLTRCDHSERYLNEEGNDMFTLNGRIKAKFVSKIVVNLSYRKLAKAEISSLFKGLKFVLTSNNINKKSLRWH